jgi:ATP-dependent Clp protease ATP-binding subunit ClpA
VIAEHLKKPLADELLFGALSKGGHVVADLQEDRVSFRFQARELAPA